MLVQRHDTGGLVERQALSLVGDPWVTEGVPRLPANLTEQAHTLKTLQRMRGLAAPHDLLRGVLAYVLAAPGKFEAKKCCSKKRISTRCYVTYCCIFVVL